jgi:cold shock CspA family protein
MRMMSNNNIYNYNTLLEMIAAVFMISSMLMIGSIQLLQPSEAWVSSPTSSSFHKSMSRPKIMTTNNKNNIQSTLSRTRSGTTTSSSSSTSTSTSTSLFGMFDWMDPNKNKNDDNENNNSNPLQEMFGGMFTKTAPPAVVAEEEIQKEEKDQEEVKSISSTIADATATEAVAAVVAAVEETAVVVEEKIVEEVEQPLPPVSSTTKEEEEVVAVAVDEIKEEKKEEVVAVAVAVEEKKEEEVAVAAVVEEEEKEEKSTTPATTRKPPTDEKIDAYINDALKTNSRIQGVVQWYNGKTGFGFIRPFETSEEEKEIKDILACDPKGPQTRTKGIFVHHSAIQCPTNDDDQTFFRKLYMRETVDFDVTTDPRNGRPVATNVTGPNGINVKAILKQKLDKRKSDQQSAVTKAGAE